MGADMQSKVLLLGPAKAGKSHFLQKLTWNKFPTDLHKTIGVDFNVRPVELPGDNTVRLQLWDAASSEGDKMLGVYAKNTQAVLLCYDTSVEFGFITATAELARYRTHFAADTPIFLLGLKSDLKAKTTEKEAKAFATSTCTDDNTHTPSA